MNLNPNLPVPERSPAFARPPQSWASSLSLVGRPPGTNFPPSMLWPSSRLRLCLWLVRWDPWTTPAAEQPLPAPIYLHRAAYLRGIARMVFLAGLDSRDLRPTLALLHLVEELALKPDLGQSLHLAYLPAGATCSGICSRLMPANGAVLNGAVAWTTPVRARDRAARQRFSAASITMPSSGSQSVPTGDAVVTLPRCACMMSHGDTSGLPLISLRGHEAIFGALGNRLRIVASVHRLVRFHWKKIFHSALLELTLRVPADCRPDYYLRGVAVILKRFIVRYREPFRPCRQQSLSRMILAHELLFQNPG